MYDKTRRFNCPLRSLFMTYSHSSWLKILFWQFTAVEDNCFIKPTHYHPTTLKASHVIYEAHNSIAVLFLSPFRYERVSGTERENRDSFCFIYATLLWLDNWKLAFERILRCRGTSSVSDSRQLAVEWCSFLLFPWPESGILTFLLWCASVWFKCYSHIIVAWKCMRM